MDAGAIVAALTATPMRAYDDLAARSPTAPPTVAGFYSWWQTPAALPQVPATPHQSEPLELLYVGIAPRSAASKSNLRRRLANHHRAAIGSSTFRLDLASFLWQDQRWTPQWTDRPKLPDEQLAALSHWQREHLVVQWVEVATPWLLEVDVVHAMRPPLNREHNAHHPFYEHVGGARDRLRAAARA